MSSKKQATEMKQDQQPQAKDLTGNALKIWTKIKDLDIHLFSLPPSKVEENFFVQNIEPTKLYLRTAIPAALPALEAAIGPKFDIEMQQQFIVVSEKV